MAPTVWPPPAWTVCGGGGGTATTSSPSSSPPRWDQVRRRCCAAWRSISTSCRASSKGTRCTAAAASTGTPGRCGTPAPSSTSARPGRSRSPKTPTGGCGSTRKDHGTATGTWRPSSALSPIRPGPVASTLPRRAGAVPSVQGHPRRLARRAGALVRVVRGTPPRQGPRLARRRRLHPRGTAHQTTAAGPTKSDAVDGLVAMRLLQPRTLNDRAAADTFVFVQSGRWAYEGLGRRTCLQGAGNPNKPVVKRLGVQRSLSRRG